MCSLIMNVASLVKVFSAGQSWEMLFILPSTDCSSLKLWLDVPAASLSRPLTSVCNLSWGRDRVKDTVSNLTPKTSPSLDPSKALVQVGSSGLLLLSLLRVVLYVPTNFSRASLADSGATAGASSTVSSYANAGKPDMGGTNALMMQSWILSRYAQAILYPNTSLSSMNRALQNLYAFNCLCCRRTGSCCTRHTYHCRT